jgi:hypothetical protein
MAKVRTDLWNWWSTPSLQILHVHSEDAVPVTPFDFHLIFLDEGPINWSDHCIWCPAPADWGPGLYIPAQSQLDLTKLLMSYPVLLSDTCSACHESYAHPIKLRYNLMRDGQYQWGVPACPADGADELHWTPDQWPPAWWFPEE